MSRPTTTRNISWVRAARKAFEGFPEPVQEEGERALVVAAAGTKPENAKPLHGLGSGIFEIVLNDRSGTYRVVYAAQIGDVLWAVHAFQKKSHKGVKTPPREIDVVRQRLKRLRKMLR